jgi:hypothetical protein
VANFPQEINRQMKKLFLPIFVFVLVLQVEGQRNNPLQLPATVIIPASDFLYDLPKGNIITDAGNLKADWLFNNTGLVLKSESNMMTQVQVPEAGKYFLFVRSHGAKESSFKITVNDKVTDSVFGSQSLCWKPGGSFDLKAALTNIKITRIDPGSVFDVLVLTKNPALKEEDIIPYQLNAEVKLLKEYKIPASGCVKFGDVTGDGLTDFMVLTPGYSSHIFDNSGKELWSWQAPDVYTKERSEFEAPGLIWDFDKDGKGEVVQWRMIDDQEWLVIADGQSGAIKRKIEWPTKALPHVYNNFRLAIAKLTSSDPNEIAVFTDMGGTIRVDAYNSSCNNCGIIQRTGRRTISVITFTLLILIKMELMKFLWDRCCWMQRERKYGIDSHCSMIIMTTLTVTSLLT